MTARASVCLNSPTQMWMLLCPPLFFLKKCVASGSSCFRGIFERELLIANIFLRQKGLIRAHTYGWVTTPPHMFFFCTPYFHDRYLKFRIAVFWTFSHLFKNFKYLYVTFGSCDMTSFWRSCHSQSDRFALPCAHFTSNAPLKLH